MSPDLDAFAPLPSARSTPAGEAILAAASELFARHGITATGVDLVARRAGVTKRTLYQRFGSKEELVAACLARRVHAWQTHLLDELDAAPAMPADLAIRTVFAAAQCWTRHPRRGCSFLGAWAEVSAQPGEAARILQEEKAWMRRLFEELVGDAERGELIHQLYEGAQVCAAIGADPSAMDRAAAAAAGLARRGRLEPHRARR